MKTTRLVLADDHALVRAGIRALLEKIPGVAVVGEAGDGRAALDVLAQEKPDVLLTDITMRGMGGLALAAEVARLHPTVRVLVLSMHANEEYVLQALQAGAAGYLLKDAVAAELALALATLAGGETYLSPAISRRVLEAYFRSSTGAIPGPLTMRQRETLRLIASGKNTKEIAFQLGISVKTVETHRAELMRRLGIHDVAGLVRYALNAGLVD
jgi:DNA-binding NarL/FixJ family response regulator